MKLFYATGTCSLFPHIVASEAGLTLDQERVDISKTQRFTATGRDYASINPNLYVPALELDDGSVLTEGVAIAQFLADLRPQSGLIPPAGTRARYDVLSWLNFIASELHKSYSPWLFHAEYGQQAQDVARSKIATRLAFVEARLDDGRAYLTGGHFGVADAYLFTIVGWSGYAKVDLTSFPNLEAYMARVGARPAVRTAMIAEGLKVVA